MRPYITHRFTCSDIASEWLFGKTGAKKSIMMKNAIDSKNLSIIMKIKNIKKRVGNRK